MIFRFPLSRKNRLHVPQGPALTRLFCFEDGGVDVGKHVGAIDVAPAGLAEEANHTSRQGYR